MDDHTAPAGDHTVTACDSCGAELTLGRAVCVTSASEHLHADKAACVAALEKRLGTYA